VKTQDIGFKAVNESDKIIQRSQLPLLGAYVEPRSATERKLVEIWRRALGMDRIGIRDNYEDLGGDSLMAASIIAELETSFGTKIPWALLADAGTIEQMAITIDDLKQGTK
jgi:acyl carrier protein